MLSSILLRRRLARRFISANLEGIFRPEELSEILLPLTNFISTSSSDHYFQRHCHLYRTAIIYPRRNFESALSTPATLFLDKTYYERPRK